jgi:hypothetical protein
MKGEWNGERRMNELRERLELSRKRSCDNGERKGQLEGKMEELR